MVETHVIIINGCATAGKDEFVQCAMEACEDTDYNVYNTSSVGRIENMLEHLGWDGSKTDEVRDLIAQMKQFWVANQNGPLNEFLDIVTDIHNQTADGDVNFIFHHVREPQEIDKYRSVFENMDIIGIHFHTLLVKRFGVGSTATNQSDNEDNINRYDYDKIITNTSIKELHEQAGRYISDLSNGRFL